MEFSQLLTDAEDSSFLTDQEGQGMIEYTLVVAILAVTIIAAMVAIGPSIRDMYSETIDKEAQGEQQAALSSTLYE
jgi:Flp pilus assembly pilin Flp